MALRVGPEIAGILSEPDHASGSPYASLVVAIDSLISAVWRALEGAAASDPRQALLAMVSQRRQSRRGQLLPTLVVRPDVGVEHRSGP